MRFELQERDSAESLMGRISTFRYITKSAMFSTDLFNV